MNVILILMLLLLVIIVIDKFFSFLGGGLLFQTSTKKWGLILDGAFYYRKYGKSFKNIRHFIYFYSATFLPFKNCPINSLIRFIEF